MNVKNNIFVNKQKISKAFNKLRKNDDNVKEGVDLSKIAEEFADRKFNDKK